MYKGLSIVVGLCAAIMALAAVGVAVFDKAYTDSMIIGPIGMVLAWISAVCWRRAPSTAPRIEVESEELQKGKKALQVLGFILLLVLFYFFMMPHMVREQVTGSMVTETIRSYNLVKGTDNKTDTCAYASAVAATMVQANDVEGYKKWKNIQAKDCELAGIPEPK